MTLEEQEHVRALGRWFYGSAPATVNEEMAALLAEMLEKVLEGSRAMHLVPRPSGGVPGVAWLASNGVRAWFRAHHEDRVYESVKSAVALSYRSRYTMAELGI